MKHDASVAESTERSDVDAAADAYIPVEFVYSIFTDTLRLPDFVGPKGRQPKQPFRMFNIYRTGFGCPEHRQRATEATPARFLQLRNGGTVNAA
ncbi:MAG: hypothetical protein ACYC27_20190 [Armatimonadota bacterium]